MSFGLVLVLSLPYHVIADNLDTSADNDLSYVPHLDIEKMIEDPNIKLPDVTSNSKPGLLRAASTTTEKVINDSNGHMSAREYYTNGKLVEKVFYNYLGNNKYQLKQRNNYHPDGKTIERIRYYNTSEWITSTKRYRENGTLDWETTYTGASNTYRTRTNHYDATGKYMLDSQYYTNNIIYKKEYRPGKGDNNITHYALYESTGTVYKEIIRYHENTTKVKEHEWFSADVNNNVMTKHDYFDINGVFIAQKLYYANGNLKSYALKNANGIIYEFRLCYENITPAVMKERTVRDAEEGFITFKGYYDTKGRITSGANYNAEGTKYKEVIYAIGSDETSHPLNMKYYNETNNLIKEENYNIESDLIVDRTTYKDNGNKDNKVAYYADTNKKEYLINYQNNNKAAYKEFYANDGNNSIIKKERYDKDGITVKWLSTYVNNTPSKVEYFAKDNNLLKEYYYTEQDTKLLNSLNTDYRDFEEGATLENVIPDAVLDNYLKDQLNIDLDSRVYVEDFKTIDKIVIIGTFNKEEYQNIPAYDKEEYIRESNQISDLSGIKFLTDLKEIKINKTSLSEISEEIGTFKNLVVLDLKDNIIDNVNEDLNNIETLEYLDLSNNNIDMLTNRYNKLMNLNYLNIDNNSNSFLNKDFYYLNTIGNLKKINISSLNFTDTDLEDSDFQMMLSTNIFDENSKVIISNNTLKQEIYANVDEELYADYIIPDLYSKLYNYVRKYNIEADTKISLINENGIETIMSSDEFNINNFLKNNLEKESKYMLNIDLEAGLLKLHYSISIEKTSTTLNDVKNILIESPESLQEIDEIIINEDEITYDILNTLNLDYGISQSELKIIDSSTRGLKGTAAKKAIKQLLKKIKKMGKKKWNNTINKNKSIPKSIKKFLQYDSIIKMFNNALDVSGKIEDMLSYSLKKMGLPTWLANKIAWVVGVVFL